MSPSLMDRIGTPLLFFAGGAGATIWFISNVMSLFNTASSEVLVFEEGPYYMLGIGIAALILAYIMIQEFWFNTPLSRTQNTIFTRLALTAMALMFTFPHVAHFAADKYLKGRDYSVCEEASHQWLFVRNIVYVQPAIECSAQLKNR